MGCDSVKINCGNVIQGPPGKNGVGIAARSTVEPPGVNLLNGGTKVEIGPDANNDGVPDSVLQTFYVAKGEPGISWAIRVTAIAAGGACGAPGGIKIEVGIDADNDGDPDTSITSWNICNGTNGTSGVTPIFVTGNTTTLLPGQAATSTVVPVPGQANTYRIDIGVPTGASGNAGATTSNGVTVGGVTLGCFAGFAGTTLTEYIQLILDKLCDMDALASLDPLFFLAKKTAVQNLYVIDTGKKPIYFEDDGTLPAADNGNNFAGVEFRAPIAMTKTFVTQGIKLRQKTGAALAGTNGFTLSIMKTPAGSLMGGGSDSVLASADYIANTAVDDYGVTLPDIVTFTTLFTMRPLYAENITLALGDKVWIAIHPSISFGATFEVAIGAEFSNT